jgi:hypothetical protein
MQGKARVAMVGLVITIAQRKGGAGKTTLATQLAVAWARCGARVAALDIDPQGSFSTWVDLRRARLGAKAIGFDFAALPGWRAAQWADDRVGSADLVVIDAPPHAETEARIAVRVATRRRRAGLSNQSHSADRSRGATACSPYRQRLIAGVNITNIKRPTSSHSIQSGVSPITGGLLPRLWYRSGQPCDRTLPRAAIGFSSIRGRRKSVPARGV